MKDLFNNNDLGTQAYQMVMEYGPRLVSAILVLIIGLWLISWITKGFSRMMDKRELDDSLKPFFRSLINIGLKTLLVISVMGMLGIEMTSFIAIIGAAGLAVGMALSGTLQNFAGGVMILMFKPFKVGDYIEAAGHAGSVREIQIFNTILTTPDNVRVILPNGQLSNTSMKNYSAEQTRRVDFTFGIGYDDDIKKAREVINKVINEDSRILSEPEPFIAVSELADSAVNLTLRVWSEASDYWPVFFDIQEKMKNTFDKEGITIPFPQREVHHRNK